MKKILTVIISLIILVLMSACGITAISGSREDVKSTIEIVNRLQTNQPTPTDIDYSLERYNLIRRTYWVNGQREKANSLTYSAMPYLFDDLKVGSYFSGIGAFETALDRLYLDDINASL